MSNQSNINNAGFRRFAWLPSGHLETIASVFNRDPRVDYTREIIKTREGDEIALDYVHRGDDAPLVVLLHGLEGCSQSRTMRVLARGFLDRDCSVAVPHFRGCGGVPNHMPRSYHAADAGEVGWMISYCRAYFPHSRINVVGVSLGGSALIHHIARDGFDSAAAVISTPFDLTACVKSIDQGMNRRLYGRHFLKSMREKIKAKAARFPSICDARKLSRITTIGEFDAVYTAPVHGFASATEYWRNASTAQLLESIQSPLLCINALNDPLVPASSLPPPPENKEVQCLRPLHGGHGAFFGEPNDWLVTNIHEFFHKHADSVEKKYAA